MNPLLNVFDRVYQLKNLVNRVSFLQTLSKFIKAFLVYFNDPNLGLLFSIFSLVIDGLLRIILAVVRASARISSFVFD